MFSLTTHSTYFIYVNWRRTYGKGHSDSEGANPLPPIHALLFSISKGSFICTIPTNRIECIREFVTPVVEHWLDREIAQ